MSACISTQGEYSDHEPDARFTCTRCHTFDEDAALAALDYAVKLLAEARGALDYYADRIDTFVWQELASPLFDAPLDGEGRDMVALAMAARRDRESHDSEAGA